MSKTRNSSDSVIKVLLKKGLKEEFESFEKKFDSKLETLEKEIDVKLDRLEKEIDNNARKYRNDVLVKLDEVMGELQTRREERTIETHQYSELVGQAENHEKRITNLEQIQKAA